MFFKILWSVNALATLVVFYFFFVGLADGTVSPRNLAGWMLILLALAGIMAGSIYLRRHGHSTPAFALLIILAIPAFLYAVFILVAMFGNVRWN